MENDTPLTPPTPPPPPPLDVACVSATEGGGSAATRPVSAVPTWMQRQQHRLTSPPPPLSRLALSAQEVCARTTTSRAPVASFEPEVHRGVALAALQRLVGPSAFAAAPVPRGVAGREAATDAPSSSSSSSPSSSATRQPAALPTLLAPADTKAPHEPSLFCATDSTDERRPAATMTTVDGAGELPWWRRILVDAAYRQRLKQLSTDAYREELRILRDAPESLSSSAEMEARKVWRERSWWEDELGKGEPRVCEGADGVTGGPAAPRGTTLPILDEVDEVVVMAQHVVLRVGQDDIAACFSTKHPRSIIDASALESVQRVALGAMPPVQHVREQQRQERAVKQHLASLRRFSRDTSMELKERLARDIAAGRADVPMQTAVTEAVMTEGRWSPHGVAGVNGGARRHPPKDHDKYVFPSPRQTTASAHGQGIASGGGDEDGGAQASSAPRTWQMPLRKPQMPPTPPWQRRRLPPGVWAVDAARTDVTRAEALLHASAIRNPLAVARRAGDLLSTTEAPKRADAAAGGTAAAAAAAAAAAVAAAVAAATDGEQQYDSIRVRRQEAAAACVDGTENLYGLQYVWRLPLPPGGFVRVSPDPRHAMWPDSDDDDGGDDGILESMDKYGSSSQQQQHQQQRMHGGGATYGASQRHHRQVQMRRLARRVNHRTHKLRWLHHIGRRRVCYNDLALSDSDGSHTGSPASSSASSSSSSSVSIASRGGPMAAASALRRIGASAKGRRSQSTRAGAQAQPRRGHSGGAGRSRRVSAPHERRRRRRASAAARPVYDGALNINIYAEVTQRPPGRVATTTTTTATDAPARALPRGSQKTQQQQQQHPTTHRRFLGCYRQSRLLIHFKLYCRALYEEERVRNGGPGANVIGRAGGGAPQYTAATSGPLAGVPAIPHPVLRLQERAPVLRKPLAHRVPVSSSIGGCRCWEGLYPTPGADLAAPMQQAWRRLRLSTLVRQALRDVFDELPHDKEGLLDKRTFVLFVLQLLELFFPTHLPAAVHIAIAEEEWVYRGTTEHVGPQTFHEKFFVFPLIFYRDIAATTEAQLVEFWTLVRVCLDAQRRQQEVTATAEAAAAAAAGMHGGVRSSSSAAALMTGALRNSLLRAQSLSLLMPLTHFTAAQLSALVSQPPPGFAAAVYDRHCLLRSAFREHPQVRAAPRGHQYVVASSVVDAQMQQREQESLGRRAGNAVATARHRASAAADPALMAARRTCLGSADTARRATIEAAAQREWEARQRRLEEQEHEALLEQSDYYHARIGRVQSRAATVISGIESTCSTWELHRTDVYAAPHEDENAEARRRPVEEDVEELLLEYLEDIPLDVFDGQVSLRERYLLHIGFQQERRKHVLPWLQHCIDGGAATAAAAATTTPTTASAAAVTTTPPRPARARQRQTAEDETRRYIAVMKSGLGAAQRRTVVMADERQLHDEARDTRAAAAAAASADAAPSPAPPPTTSYASGTYPLRAVPRTMSAVLGSHRPRRRRDEDGAGEASLSATRTGRRVTAAAASSASSSFYGGGGGGGGAPRTQHWRKSTLRGVRHSVGEAAGAEDALTNTARRLGGWNKSFYRKPTAARPRQLGRSTLLPPVPGAPSALAVPLLDMSDNGDDDDGDGDVDDALVTYNGRLEPNGRAQPLPSETLRSHATPLISLEATGSPSVMFLDLCDEVASAAPASVLLTSHGGSVAAAGSPDPSPRLPHPPRAQSTTYTTAPQPVSSSLLLQQQQQQHYAQRLRAQQHRQQQYKRQYNNNNSAAAAKSSTASVAGKR
ncbi:hypothetical protein NESM_000701600 [Novymonas esmeraldas]|uniref:EF-hand domain-containing protein n=1 Tax=Novymonas esmeraldas TaxID=1808958 RepID=A0AAW0ETM7_9TRYP